MNYRLGYIYKIICSLDSSVVYIGSTFKKINQRFQKHKNQYGYFLEGKYNNFSIYEYFTKYGIENFHIILIKKYYVCDRKHLLALEQLWINAERYKVKKKAINISTSFSPIYKTKVQNQIITCGRCNKTMKYQNYFRHIQSHTCINFIKK